MNEMLFTILGLAGAGLIVGMYWALQRGLIKADDPKFYAVNGIGAFMIAMSIAVDYDSADLGGIVVEIAWVLISIIGLWKHLKKGKTHG